VTSCSLEANTDLSECYFVSIFKGLSLCGEKSVVLHRQVGRSRSMGGGEEMGSS
jgi:hypothetical protein